MVMLKAKECGGLCLLPLALWVNVKEERLNYSVDVTTDKAATFGR